jgi:hypothetical protein
MWTIRLAASNSLVALAAACVACVGTVDFAHDATTDHARGVDGAHVDATDADRALDAPSDANESDSARDGATSDAADTLLDARVCPMRGAPMDCSPGSGTGEAAQCRDGPSCFVGDVQRAVQNVLMSDPSNFDTSGACPRILDVQRFMNAVVTDLRSQDLCAIRDPNAPDEEVTVKRDNLFAESFDIVASTGCARFGAAIYTGYCAPAWW